MSALIWSALGFFLFVLLVSAAGLALLGLRGWRQVRALRTIFDASFAELTASVAVLERRLDGVGQRSAELGESVDRLSVSLARARTLLDAVQEVRGVFGRVRGLIPQK